MKKLNQNNAIATTAMLTKTNTMKNKMNFFAKVLTLVAMMGMSAIEFNCFAEVTGPAWGKEGEVWYVLNTSYSSESEGSGKESIHSVYMPVSTSYSATYSYSFTPYKVDGFLCTSCYPKITMFVNTKPDITSSTDYATNLLTSGTICNPIVNTLQNQKIENQQVGIIDFPACTSVKIGWSGTSCSCWGTNYHNDTKAYNLKIPLPHHTDILQGQRSYSFDDTEIGNTAAPIEIDFAQFFKSFYTSGDITATIEGTDASCFSFSSTTTEHNLKIANAGSVYANSDCFTGGTGLCIPASSKIYFTPSKAGTLYATITVAYDGGSFSITLSGTGKLKTPTLVWLKSDMAISDSPKNFTEFVAAKEGDVNPTFSIIETSSTGGTPSNAVLDIANNTIKVKTSVTQPCTTYIKVTLTPGNQVYSQIESEPHLFTITQGTLQDCDLSWTATKIANFSALKDNDANIDLSAATWNAVNCNSQAADYYSVTDNTIASVGSDGHTLTIHKAGATTITAYKNQYSIYRETEVTIPLIVSSSSGCNIPLINKNNLNNTSDYTSDKFNERPGKVVFTITTTNNNNAAGTVYLKTMSMSSTEYLHSWYIQKNQSHVPCEYTIPDEYKNERQFKVTGLTYTRRLTSFQVIMASYLDEVANVSYSFGEKEVFNSKSLSNIVAEYGNLPGVITYQIVADGTDNTWDAFTFADGEYQSSFSTGECGKDNKGSANVTIVFNPSKEGDHKALLKVSATIDANTTKTFTVPLTGKGKRIAQTLSWNDNPTHPIFTGIYNALSDNVDLTNAAITDGVTTSDGALKVEYSSSDPSVADTVTINGIQYIDFKKSGTFKLIANCKGNSVYLDANQLESEVITVSLAKPHITPSISCGTDNAFVFGEYKLTATSDDIGNTQKHSDGTISFVRPNDNIAELVTKTDGTYIHFLDRGTDDGTDVTITVNITASSDGVFDKGSTTLTVKAKKVSPSISWTGPGLENPVANSTVPFTLGEMQKGTNDPDISSWDESIKIVYSTSDNEFAEVINNSQINFKKHGQVTIKANIPAGINNIAASEVTHDLAIACAPQSISWTPAATEYKVGNTITLDASSPANNITYSTSDADIVSTDGVCHKAGYVQITASSADNGVFCKAASASKSFHVDFADNFFLTCKDATVDNTSDTGFDMTDYFVPSNTSYTVSSSSTEFVVTKQNNSNYITIQFSPTSVNNGDSDTEEKEATITITDNGQKYHFTVKATAEKKDATLVVNPINSPYVFSTITPNLGTQTTDATNVTYTYYDNNDKQLATGSEYKLTSINPIKIIATTSATSTYKAGTSEAITVTPQAVTPTITFDAIAGDAHVGTPFTLNGADWASATKTPAQPAKSEWTDERVDIYYTSDLGSVADDGVTLTSTKAGYATITAKINEAGNHTASYNQPTKGLKIDFEVNKILSCTTAVVMSSSTTTFNLANDMVKSGTLNVVSCSNSEFNVTFSGYDMNVTFIPTTAGERTANLAFSDANMTYNLQLSATATAPTITFNPTEIGTASVSTNTLDISAITLTSLSSDGNIRLVDNGTEYVLPYNGTITGPLTFKYYPTEVETNAEHKLTVNSTYEIIYNVTSTQHTINFADTKVGVATAQQQFEMTNFVATGALTAYTSSSEFRINGTRCISSNPTTITSGATLNIDFSPRNTCDFTTTPAQLIINDNGTLYKVNLTGKTEDLEPIDLGTVNIGQASEAFEIDDIPQTGTVTVTSSSPYVFRVFADDEEATLSTATANSSIDVSGKDKLYVKFYPETAREQTATITISIIDSYGETSSYSVNVSGTGVQQTFDVSSTMGQLSDAQIELTNMVSAGGYTVSLTKPVEFRINDDVIASIDVTGGSSLRIKLYPKTSGNKSETVTILDKSTNRSYTINLTGTVTALPNLSFNQQKVAKTDVTDNKTITLSAWPENKYELDILDNSGTSYAESFLIRGVAGISSLVNGENETVQFRPKKVFNTPLTLYAREKSSGILYPIAGITASSIQNDEVQLVWSDNSDPIMIGMNDCSYGFAYAVGLPELNVFYSVSNDNITTCGEATLGIKSGESTPRDHYSGLQGVNNGANATVTAYILQSDEYLAQPITRTFQVTDKLSQEIVYQYDTIVLTVGEAFSLTDVNAPYAIDKVDKDATGAQISYSVNGGYISLNGTNLSVNAAGNGGYIDITAGAVTYNEKEYLSATKRIWIIGVQDEICNAEVCKLEAIQATQSSKTQTKTYTISDFGGKEVGYMSAYSYDVQGYTGLFNIKTSSTLSIGINGSENNILDTTANGSNQHYSGTKPLQEFTNGLSSITIKCVVEGLTNVGTSKFNGAYLYQKKYFNKISDNISIDAGEAEQYSSTTTGYIEVANYSALNGIIRYRIVGPDAKSFKVVGTQTTVNNVNKTFTEIACGDLSTAKVKIEFTPQRVGNDYDATLQLIASTTVSGTITYTTLKIPLSGTGKPRTQQISWAQGVRLANLKYDDYIAPDADKDIELTAYSSIKGQEVSYAFCDDQGNTLETDPTFVSLSGKTLTINGAGDTYIKATQAGKTDGGTVVIEPAVPVILHVIVAKADPKLKWNTITKNEIYVYDSVKIFAYSQPLVGIDEHSDGTISYSIAEPTLASYTPEDSLLHANNYGQNAAGKDSISITATISETANYLEKDTTMKFKIMKVKPALTWGSDGDLTTDMSVTNYTIADGDTAVVDKSDAAMPDVKDWKSGKNVTYTVISGDEVIEKTSDKTFTVKKVGYATIQAQVEAGNNNEASEPIVRHLKVDFNPTDSFDLDTISVYDTNTVPFDLSVIEASGPGALRAIAIDNDSDFTYNNNVVNNKLPVTFMPQSHDAANPVKSATITIYDSDNKQEYHLVIKGTTALAQPRLKYNDQNYNGWEFVVQLPNETTQVIYGSNVYDVDWDGAFPDLSSAFSELYKSELSLKEQSCTTYVDIINNSQFKVKQANVEDDDPVNVTLVVTYPGVQNKIASTFIEIPIKIKKNQYSLNWNKPDGFDIEIYQGKKALAAPTLTPTGGDSIIKYSFSEGGIASYDGDTLRLLGGSYKSVVLTATIASDKYAIGTSADLQINIKKTDQYVAWTGDEISAGFTTQQDTTTGFVLSGVAKRGATALTGANIFYYVTEVSNCEDKGPLIRIDTIKTTTPYTHKLYYTGNGSGTVSIQAIAEETELYNRTRTEDTESSPIIEFTITKEGCNVDDFAIANMHYGDKVTLAPAIDKFTKGTNYEYTLPTSPEVTGTLEINSNILDVKGVGNNLTISAKKLEDCWVTASTTSTPSNQFNILKSKQMIEWDKKPLGTPQSDGAYHFSVFDNNTTYQLATQAIDTLHTNQNNTCLDLTNGRYVTANLSGNAPGRLTLGYTVFEEDGKVCKVDNNQGIVTIENGCELRITGNGTGTVLVIASVTGRSYYEDVADTIKVVVDKAPRTIAWNNKNTVSVTTASTDITLDAHSVYNSETISTDDEGTKTYSISTGGENYVEIEEGVLKIKDNISLPDEDVEITVNVSFANSCRYADKADSWTFTLKKENIEIQNAPTENLTFDDLTSTTDDFDLKSVLISSLYNMATNYPVGKYTYSFTSLNTDIATIDAENGVLKAYKMTGDETPLQIVITATETVTGSSDSETIKVVITRGTLIFNVAAESDNKWTNPANWSREDIVTGHTDINNKISDLSEYNVLINGSCFIGKDEAEDADETAFLSHTINALCNDLMINQNEENNAKLVIGEASTLNVKGNLTNSVASKLVLTANYWGQASVVFNSGSPKATIEMYVPEGNGSRTSPIWQYRGICVDGFAAVDGPWECMAIYQWNEADNADLDHGCWNVVTNGGGGKENIHLSPWIGYGFANICSDDNLKAENWLTYSGTLINSAADEYLHEFILTKTPSTNGVDYANYGVNLLTNSYTAPMTIGEVGFENANATVTFYNAGTHADWEEYHAGADTLGEYGKAGQMTVCPKNTSKEAHAVVSIPAGQSFFVTANSDGNIVKFSYDSIIKDLGPSRRMFLPGERESEYNVLGIRVKGKENGDRLVLLECETCTRQYDNGYDGYKMLGKEGLPQIYAYNKFGNTAVNADSTLNKQYVGFMAGSDDETYTISFETDKLFGYHSLYLTDRKLNETVDILAGETYQFKGYTVGENMRFQINGITEQEWNNENDDDDDDDDDDDSNVCDLRIVGNTLYIQGFTTDHYPAARVELFDMTGNSVWSTPLTSERLYDLPQLPQGIYTVRLGDCHVKYSSMK